VARVLGASHIPAYVTEVEIKVPLSADVQPDELIIQAKQADFLEETRLDKTRPEADLQVTAPGQYRLLRQEIGQHRQWLRRHGNSAITLAEAAATWYDEVYLPIATVIRRRGILRYFPGRTETDLYVWIGRHREELAQELGWEVKAEAAASDLAQRFSPGPQQVLARVKQRVLAAITPDPLDAGPPAGRWREVEVATRIEPTLFADILVPVRGDETGRRALQQALVVARRENGRLHGLHVLTGEEAAAREKGGALQAAFQEQIEEAGATGELSLELGRVARTICKRAQYNDLVVMALTYLPGAQPVSRLSSGFGTLVRRCGRPVLAVPATPSPLERPLLAYDGSPKAKEALFVAAYLAAKWELPLTVVTVDEAERAAAATLEDARLYLLARGVSADYVAGAGVVSEVLQQTAEAHACDLIVMGGYGFRPLLEVVLGSTVDQALRWRRWPVLICR
jgi:nucleotide-binding universal stress UspA family protein